MAEVYEIEKAVGVLMQTESAHGAEVGSPRIAYPLDLERFKAAAKAKGLWKGEKLEGDMRKD